jgi:hypothetical protein
VKATNYASTNSPQTAWGRFWFQPTDPTVLGFMRIVTGLIAFYVHLAYSYDLGAFFGPDAYINQKAANRWHSEAPVMLQPWLDWDEKQYQIATPILPDRREAFFQFLRALPEDKQERNRTLAYLYEFLENNIKQKNSESISNETMIAGMDFLKAAGELDEEQRTSMYLALTRDSAFGFNTKDSPITVPHFFFHEEMTAERRGQLWIDALKLSDFLWNIPAWQIGDYQATQRKINFVLEWCIELPQSQRVALAKFIKELPGGEEGRKILEYYDFWRMDPRDTYAQGAYNFSIWFHISDPGTMWTVHICALIVFLLFTLGVFTRVTSVLAWLTALQYIHRSQQILFGMDTMMNILLFYLMIGPSGAALSVDRLIARYRAARAIFKAGGRPVPWADAVLAGPQPSALANFVLRLFQIHFCIMYAAAGLSKLKGGMWWRTTATWYTIANPEFTPLNYSAYEWVLRQIASIKPLMLIIFGTFAYFTLIMEICFPFLVWTRLRPVVISLALFMHAGIAIIMGLTCFQLLMFALILCYFPASVVRGRLFWEQGAGAKMTLRFDSRNPKQMRLVAFLRAFDVSSQIVCHDEPGKANDVELIGADGRHSSGSKIIKYAAANLVFARTIRWLLYVPGVSLMVRTLTGAGEANAATKQTHAAEKTAKTPAAR